MELEYESDSEIINSKNNYKFDNYGIVMADSIEDLLYDKYYYTKKRKKNYSNSSNKESSESVKKENGSNEDNIKNEIDKQKENNLNDSDNDNNINKEKEKENKMNEIEKNKGKNLKIMRCKDFEIKNTNNNDKNKKIKIIFNVNNKEKKEIEINPFDTNLIKNVNIKAKDRDLNNKNEYKNVKNNREIENKGVKNNIESKNKKSLFYNEKINNKDKDIKKRFSIDKMKLKKYNSKNELLKIDSKGKEYTSNIRNAIKNKNMKENTKNENNHIIKLNVNLIKKKKNKKYLIHNIPISSQCYIEKIRKNKNVLFHKAIPKLNRVFITKSYIKKERDTNNKIKTKNKNILNIPNSSMCYFTKKFRIINIYSHIPLQNVVNNFYFSTKEIINYFSDKINSKKLAKKDKKKNKDDDDEKIDANNYYKFNNENKEFNKNNNDKKIKIYKKPKFIKKKEKKDLDKNSNNDNININKNNINMPNIIIKILNSSYKKNYGGQKYIRPNSSTINSRNSNMATSKLLKRINDSNSIFNIKKNNNNNLYLLPLKAKKIRKLRNIYSHHYRYDPKNKSEPDFHNKEIVSALNINPRYKSNCPACFILTRNTKFQDEFDRLKSQKMSKSEKNMKIRPLAMMEFRNNVNVKKDFRNNLRNNLILSQNREEMANNNKFENLLSQSKTKFINYYRNNNQRKNSIDSNIGFSFFNKNSYFTHIEFPAIDSYFH